MGTTAPPPDNVWPFSFPAQDWSQTPPSVQAYILQLQDDLRHLSAVWKLSKPDLTQWL
jgi:hypothetical protein